MWPSSKGEDNESLKEGIGVLVGGRFIALRWAIVIRGVLSSGSARDLEEALLLRVVGGPGRLSLTSEASWESAKANAIFDKQTSASTSSALGSSGKDSGP